jgi:hypothetical protein
MRAKTKAALIALGVGTVVGIGLAQYTMGRHRRDLFSPRALRRLSALGYLSGQSSVETVRLLRDYLTWEEHPMLRRRAQTIVRRMEEKLA